jgi:hypothetical protein
MTGKLKDGFEIQIPDENVGNWELLEVLEDLSAGDSGLIVKAARMFLGKEGLAVLKDHLRDESGRIATEDVIDALNDLMESTNELKNSEPSPA